MTPIEYSRKLTGATQGTYLLADHCSGCCFDNYIFHFYLPRAPLTPSRGVTFALFLNLPGDCQGIYDLRLNRNWPNNTAMPATRLASNT